MERKKNFKILVLEDNEFYNSILTMQIQHFTQIFSSENDCKFEIESYTSVNDCMRNLKEDTDIAFLDYYLGYGITATDVSQKIKRTCKNCCVVIISRSKGFISNLKVFREGALEFIQKDAHTFSKICHIIEDVVSGELT